MTRSIYLKLVIFIVILLLDSRHCRMLGCKSVVCGRWPQPQPVWGASVFGSIRIVFLLGDTRTLRWNPSDRFFTVRVYGTENGDWWVLANVCLASFSEPVVGRPRWLWELCPELTGIESWFDTIGEWKRIIHIRVGMFKIPGQSFVSGVLFLELGGLSSPESVLLGWPS